jgi:hypothetical protein
VRTRPSSNDAQWKPHWIHVCGSQTQDTICILCSASLINVVFAYRANLILRKLVFHTHLCMSAVYDQTPINSSLVLTACVHEYVVGKCASERACAVQSVRQPELIWCDNCDQCYSNVIAKNLQKYFNFQFLNHNVSLIQVISSSRTTVAIQQWCHTIPRDTGESHRKYDNEETESYC